MPMKSYPVRCYAPGCGSLAAFKIAAQWSDGVTRELKTYYLTCPACLAKLFSQAVEKHAKCRLASGETLEGPGIYEIARGERDRSLQIGRAHV